MNLATRYCIEKAIRITDTITKRMAGLVGEYQTPLLLSATVSPSYNA